MARTLVLKDGVLSAVVESFEAVELAQLQADVEAKQNTVNSLNEQLESLNVQLAEANVALEDSKSESADGERLVAESAPADAGTQTNDDGSVPVDVTVASGAEEL